MFTLRRVLEDGYEFNFLLGKSYTLILKERVSKEEWSVISKNYWGETYNERVLCEKDLKNEVRCCFGFIQSEYEEHFLLPWQKNYIMAESGKTFSNLSLK